MMVLSPGPRLDFKILWKCRLFRFGLFHQRGMLWLTICKFALLFCFNFPPPRSHCFMSATIHVQLSANWCVIFPCLLSSWCSFFDTLCARKTSSSGDWFAAWGGLPPTCFHWLFYEHNHLCSNISWLFCCPSLSSFLLVALSLTPFVQFFKWLVCFWGVTNEASLVKVNLQNFQGIKIFFWKLPKGSPLDLCKNVTNEAFLVKVHRKNFQGFKICFWKSPKGKGTRKWKGKGKCKVRVSICCKPKAKKVSLEFIWYPGHKLNNAQQASLEFLSATKHKLKRQV